FITALSNTGIKFSLNGNQEQCHPANINVQFEGVNASELLKALQPTVAASSGSACNSEMVLPSHVLKAIGLTDMQALSSLRFSLGRYTDDTQISETVKAIKKEL
ncbi:aminotransferase class V-fold PLP-dependent enzyme, partial [Methylophaga sp.]|uniref:aminotransferase class V-fold PLP-dependent enzyme n=1 Tax=Methylophaga sp. TaxID=2024840 RepID=UPI003F6950BD